MRLPEVRVLYLMRVSGLRHYYITVYAAQLLTAEAQMMPARVWEVGNFEYSAVPILGPW